MGLRREIVIVILLLLSFVPAVHGQTVAITGRIVDRDTQKPVGGATVSIRNAKNVILYSTFSTGEGAFSLSALSSLAEGCMLCVGSMGYEPVRVVLTGKSRYDIQLLPKPFEIKDVYVRPKKIVHRNDTTRYLVSSFTTQKDRTIGDVLHNMPGIDVEKDGTVSFNGKHIDKFLIEGLDLFDGQYNLATENVSHRIISTVDIYENQQTKKALRGKGHDDETILNLRLKDKAKGHWSGNLEASAGLPGLWEGELFDALLAAGHQTSVTVKSNNSGKDITRETKTLTLDEYASLLGGSSLSPLLDVTASTPSYLDDSRTRRSRAHVFHVANIRKLSDYTTLRSKLYYNDDRNIADIDNDISYFLTDSVFHYATTEHEIVNDRELGASVSVKTDKENAYFSEELRYSSQWQRNKDDIEGSYTGSALTHSDIHKIENRMEYVIPWARNYLRIVSVNRFGIMPERLSLGGDSCMQENIDRYHFYSSTMLDYTYSLKRWSLSVNLEERFFVSNLHNILPAALSANSTMHSRTSYLATVVCPELSYRYQGLRLKLKLGTNACHYIAPAVAMKVYFNPELNVDWQINSTWKMMCRASLGETAPEMSQVHDQPVMTDYRTYYVRPACYEGVTACSTTFGLAYSDYSNMLFVNASVGYNRSNNHQVMSKQLEQDVVCYSWMKGDNRVRRTMVAGNVSKRFDAIKSMVSLRCLYLYTNASILQNDIMSPYSSQTVNTQLKISSDPLSWLNVSYSLAYARQLLKMEASRSSSYHINQRLLVTGYPTDRINVSLQAEHYVSSLGEGKPKQDVLFDILCSYRLGKVDLTLSCKNILNQRYYYQTAYSDISESVTKYMLRGRNIMVGVTLYF